MDVRKFFKFISICIISLTWFAISYSASLFSQDVDPFYLKRLREGEKSFLAQNYKEASKELEIAAFGLQREKKLKAKALIYLSMCHYYLKDMERSEKYMRQAVDLIGKDKITSVEKEIHESTREDFRKLLNQFKLKPPKKKKKSLASMNT